MPFLEKLVQKVHSLKAKHFYGFTSGHQELTQEQIDHMLQVMRQAENNNVIREYETQFASLIGTGFGQSFLAARMAFYGLMTVLNIGEGDEVILPAFTCAVMPNAVWRRGARPVFADIDPQTYGSDADTIEKKINMKTKMIVAQHSFGIPCQIEKIAKLGEKYNIFVLEDAAIALGSSRDGIKLGDWGDASIFSTDHTKPVNTMVGGMLYTKKADLFKSISQLSASLPHLSKDHQVKIFQQLLFEKENNKPEQLGRVPILKVLQRFQGKDKNENSVFLENDYSKNDISEGGYPYPAQMPTFLAQLGLYELKRWPDEVRQRQEILKKYLKLMQDRSLDDALPQAYRDQRNVIVPLRFAFSLPQAEQMKKALISYMDVSHFWFQSPVICCPQGPEHWGYQNGSCPVAEKISQCIINWPTVVPEGESAQLIEYLRGTCKI